ncbi:MAG TPA: gamma-glutamylcyclotransferase, partial [Blastocatellia bacterium]|nr:gamma-glutamylcyclotransferase [Blastocatellia bacterium]
MSEYLFVYGTLQPAAAPPELKDIIDRWRKVGSGTVLGQLFDLGDYPGAVLDENSTSRVIGDVYELRDPAALATLDEYEGFDADAPEQSLFHRVRTEVKMAEGGTQPSWIYVYNRDVSNLTPRKAGLTRWSAPKKKAAKKSTKAEKELNEQQT